MKQLHGRWFLIHAMSFALSMLFTDQTDTIEIDNTVENTQLFDYVCSLKDWKFVNCCVENNVRPN